MRINRLDDEVGINLGLRKPVAVIVAHAARLIADVGLAARIDLVHQVEEQIADRGFLERFADGKTDDVAGADAVFETPVEHFDDVVGTVRDADHRRRFAQDAMQPRPFAVGVFARSLLVLQRLRGRYQPGVCLFSHQLTGHVTLRRPARGIHP
jgi:hypothetical protein